MTEVVPSATTTAYLNWGRWVAECPFCKGAMTVELGQPDYYCLPPAGCNGRAAVLWPSDAPMVDAAVGGAVTSAFAAVDPSKCWHEGEEVPR